VGTNSLHWAWKETCSVKTTSKVDSCYIQLIKVDMFGVKMIGINMFVGRLVSFVRTGLGWQLMWYTFYY